MKKLNRLKTFYGENLVNLFIISNLNNNKEISWFNFLNPFIDLIMFRLKITNHLFKIDIYEKVALAFNCRYKGRVKQSQDH